MLKLHHIGIVVKDIAAYLKNSQYNRSTEIIYDPVQHSNICMLKNIYNEPPIELIEPIDEASTTYQHLQRNGNSIHHLCYQIDSYEKLEEYMGKHKLKRIFGPVEATVFNGEKVVFSYSRNQGIVEFLLLSK